MDPIEVKAVMDWPISSSRKELQQNTPFVLSQSAEEAFRELERPTLTFPDTSRQFVVNVVGVILSSGPPRTRGPVL